MRQIKVGQRSLSLGEERKRQHEEPLQRQRQERETLNSNQYRGGNDKWKGWG